MKKTAVAPSNIAFIKYWGKADDELRLPLNGSISMNLSGAYTVTTVHFSPEYEKDTVTLVDSSLSEKEQERVKKTLDQIRQRSKIQEYAKVVTKNTFPKGAGAAASASGFAALSMAGFAAAGQTLSEKELTIFARMGSGSACRSIPDGFVLWEQGFSSETSFAFSLFPHDYWELCDALIIVDSQMKKVSTSEGMETVHTSPLLSQRLAIVPSRISLVKRAIEQKDFFKLGELIEEDCLDMHHVMQTQIPPLNYWNDKTKEIMKQIESWRKSGLPIYYTIDAGPNVHAIFEKKNEPAVLEKLKELVDIEKIIMNYPAKGTELIENHLF